MAKLPVTEVVASLAAPHAVRVGLEVVDVEFVREGGQKILRVLIDREGGVSLEDCETMSKAGRGSGPYRSYPLQLLFGSIFAGD